MGDRLRSSKKALKVAIKGDFKGFKEPTRVSVSPTGIKVLTPVKFSGKRGTLSEYVKNQLLALFRDETEQRRLER